MRNERLCKNCNSVNVQRFCSDCGQKVYDKRFTVKDFFAALLASFELESGLLYTIKMLFIRPGTVTTDYINGRTKPYFNPVKYLLIISGIYAFLLLWLNIFDAGMEAMQANEFLQSDSEQAMQLQKHWINFYKQIINFIPLLMIPFISMASKWFYKSKKLFYAEHLIIYSFLFVQSIIIIILLTPLVLIFPSLLKLFPIVTLIVIIGYFSYSLHDTFRESPFKSVLKACSCLIVGYLLFLLFLMFMLLSAIFVISMKQTPAGLM